MWEVRVSVQGVAKSVQIESTSTIDDLKSAVRSAFKLGDEMTIMGGFPPRELTGVVGEATQDRALLLAVADAVEVRNAAEALGRPEAVDVRVVADEPDLLLVPGVTVVGVLVVAPEVHVVEEHPVDALVVVVV